MSIMWLTQARSQPSDNRGGVVFQILDLFQGLKVLTSHRLSRGNLNFYNNKD